MRLLLLLLSLAVPLHGSPDPEATARRTKPEIERALKAIEAKARGAPPAPRWPKAGKDDVPPPTSGELAKARAELARLNGYRYLAGLSHDITLEDELGWTAKFGAELCRRHGTIDHTPPRPSGMPEAAYKRGYEGTSKSNLHWTSSGNGLVGSVDAYMDDSDPANVRVVGHRRWCLNPPMRKTGFGVVEGFSAMWVFDTSGPAAPGAIVCFPSSGLHPIDYFTPGTAWSVSLDPARYRVSGTSIKVFELRTPAHVRGFPDDLKGLREVPLTDVRLSTEGSGIPQCLIFRPQAKVGKGDRFGVIIEGVSGLNGSRLAYKVEFY
jgi:uncharacterized protein YkwD